MLKGRGVKNINEGEAGEIYGMVTILNSYMLWKKENPA